MTGGTFNNLETDHLAGSAGQGNSFGVNDIPADEQVNRKTAGDVTVIGDVDR